MPTYLGISGFNLDNETNSDVILSRAKTRSEDLCVAFETEGRQDINCALFLLKKNKASVNLLVEIETNFK